MNIISIFLFLIGIFIQFVMNIYEKEIFLIFLMLADLFNIIKIKIHMFLKMQIMNILMDEELREQTNKMFKNQLERLINDEELRNQTNQMFKNQLDRLIIDEELQLSLRNNIISNAKILSVDETIVKSITEIIQTQLESTNTSERTRVALAALAKRHIEDMVQEEWFITNVKDRIVQLVQVTCDSTEIKNKIRTTIENVGDDLTKSEETNKIINDFLLKIVNDKEFMKQSGTAIRRSLKHAAYGMFWNYNDGDRGRSQSVDSNVEYTLIDIKKTS